MKEKEIKGEKDENKQNKRKIRKRIKLNKIDDLDLNKNKESLNKGYENFFIDEDINENEEMKSLNEKKKNILKNSERELIKDFENLNNNKEDKNKFYFIENIDKYDVDALRLYTLYMWKSIIMNIFPQIKENEKKTIEKRLEGFKKRKIIKEYKCGMKVMMKFNQENKLDDNYIGPFIIKFINDDGSVALSTNDDEVIYTRVGVEYLKQVDDSNKVISTKDYMKAIGLEDIDEEDD